MIKMITRAIYSAFISIVLISIILVTWTGYAFVAQPTKSSEIVYFIQDIYESQKSVIVDFVDLSKLLLKETGGSNANKNNKLLKEDELLSEIDSKSNLDESSNPSDNGDNPLGIVVEPSISEVRENRLSKILEEPINNNQGEIPINEMKWFNYLNVIII